MKMVVRNTLLVVLSMWLLGSCDDTEESLLRINVRPEINYTFLENTISTFSDSVKVSRGSSRRSYEQNVTVKDVDDNLLAVYYIVTSGQGSVNTNGVFTRDLLQESGTGRGIYSFVYRPRAIGFHEVEIYAEDTFREMDTVILKLVAFDNLPPVAKVNVTPIRIISEFEYTIDGSQSFDSDSDFGGEVVEWEFNINSQVITLENPSFRFVFGEEQIVTIGLKVKDNDGVWSEKVEGIFSID